MSAAEILQQIRGLNPVERRELVQRVWHEYREELKDWDEELTPERVVELEKRAEDLRRHPETGIPWAQVRSGLKDRLKEGG